MAQPNDSEDHQEIPEKYYIFKNDFGFNQNVDITHEVAKNIPKQVPLHILVVEDDNINRTVMIKILNKIGYKDAKSVENGEQALCMVKNNLFDIIFMDIKMPVMNGLKTTQKIIEYVNKNNIKVPKIIALTSYWYEKYRNIYSNVGITEFLSKPVKISEIQDILIKYGN